MLPTSTYRVSRHTPEYLNQEFKNQIMQHISNFADALPSDIDRRIDELDREWDIERTLEANAAALALTGVALGAFVSRKWLVLPAVVTGFLLQHALQGWCPPVPVFRRLGYRTPHEIEMERFAMKALRGDFNEIVDGGRGNPAKIFEAVAS